MVTAREFRSKRDNTRFVKASFDSRESRLKALEHGHIQAQGLVFLMDRSDGDSEDDGDKTSSSISSRRDKMEG